MKTLRAKLRSLSKNPRYALMRAFGRFAAVRSLVRRARGVVQLRRHRKYCHERERKLRASVFVDAKPAALLQALRDTGVGSGLRIPAELLREIHRYAGETRVFADRDERLGFHLDQRDRAERELDKPILVAQYFNTEAGCPTIGVLATDPLVELIAARYLGSVPKLVGIDMWWTYPVDATEHDRDRHAHLFHRDVDDFSFVKFFFYLTDVNASDGPHVCVLGSHRRAPLLSWRDRLILRRYTDDEIESFYATDQLLAIEGSAGTGFVEDTTCVHKGTTPTRNPRLLLQFEYALFDYGAMHDRRPATQLESFV